jgi:hypothetical protein
MTALSRLVTAFARLVTAQTGAGAGASRFAAGAGAEIEVSVPLPADDGERLPDDRDGQLDSSDSLVKGCREENPSPGE